MPVFNNALAGAAGAGGDAGYKIERSLRFDSDDSSHLTNVFGGADRKKWTLSFWYKPVLQNTNNRRQIFSAENGSVTSIMNFRDSDDSFEMYHYNGSSLNFQICSTASFRDPAAWYHFVVAWDTTQATSTDRVKVWVNGERITQWKISNWPGHNTDYVLWNDNNVTHRIGRSASHYLSGYLAEMHFIDSIVKDETAFGEYKNGVWQPIEYDGIYNSTSAPLGVNGFYLDFSDTSSNTALGIDHRPGATQDPTGTTYGTITGGNVANVFDGVASYTSELDLRPDGSGVTLDVPVTATSSVRIYGSSERTSVARYQINGNNTSAVPQTYPNRGWTTISGLTFPITITSFGIGGAQSNDGGRLSAIEIDGTILTGTANNWSVSNLTNVVQTYTASTGAGALDSTIFNGTNTKTYWRNPITITGITVASGSSFGYRGVVESGNSAPSHTITKNGTQIGSFTGTVGNNNWVASTNYTVNQGTISEAIGPSDTVTITTDVQAWHGADQITINGNAIVQPSLGSQDSLIDSPTDYEADSGDIGGNHCTLNPLTTTGGNSGTSNGILSNGNLTLTNPSSNTWSVETGTIGVQSGKWYYEVHPDNGVTGSLVGWADPQEINYNDAVGNTARSYGYYATGNARNSNNNSALGSSYTDGDVIGCAIDIDNKKIYWSKNGTFQNSANLVTGTGSVYTIQDPVANGFFYTPAVSTYDASSTLDCNFGQRPFKYPPGGTGGPPSDYKSLCTKNLPDPQITDSSAYFDTKLWTGNGVQMKVGGPIYSTTSTMSSAANAFNGNESNGAVFGTASVLTSSPITITSSLQLKHNRNGGNGITVNINGTDYTATGNSNSAYHTIPIPGSALPLTSTGNITVTDNDGNSTLYAVKVDGNVLTDGTGDPYSFSPDLVWTKQRNSTGFHALFDPIRGVHNALRSHSNGGTYTDNGLLTAFNSDGFTVGSAGDINGTNNTYVGWAWDAGSSNTSVSVGGLNSSIYDTSENWVSTGTVTGTPANSNYTFSPLFDGDLTSLGPQSNSMTQYVYTFANTLSATANTIIFYSTDNTANVPSANTGGYYINGTQVTTNNCTKLNSSSPYKYRMDGLTTLSSIGTQQKGNLTGIEVNGKLLVDSNAHTIPNAPAAASTHRANPAAGFSIVKVDNPNSTESRAHGLGKKPDLIIGKALTGSQQWHIYHSALGKGYYGTFETNSFSSSDQWGSKEPDSNLFYVKSNTGSGANFAGGMIYYIWTGIQDHSTFGRYTGNGNSNGTFVYTGFRPAFVVMKATSSSGGWRTYDSTRKTYNVMDNSLHWNTTEDETVYSNDEIDFLSNGFKMRGNGSFFNGNNVNYIYYAISEHPFKTGRAR